MKILLMWTFLPALIVVALVIFGTSRKPDAIEPIKITQYTTPTGKVVIAEFPDGIVCVMMGSVDYECRMGGKP